MLLFQSSKQTLNLVFILFSGHSTYHGRINRADNRLGELIMQGKMVVKRSRDDLQKSSLTTSRNSQRIMFMNLK